MLRPSLRPVHRVLRSIVWSVCLSVAGQGFSWLEIAGQPVVCFSG